MIDENRENLELIKNIKDWNKIDINVNSLKEWGKIRVISKELLKSFSIPKKRNTQSL